MVVAGALGLAPLACEPHPSTESVPTVAEAEIQALTTRIEVEGRDLETLSERIRLYQEDARAVVRTYERATADYERARAMHENASARYERAGRSAAHATADFAHATETYERAATTVLLAAAADFGTRGSTGCTVVSTAEYRRRLRSEGVDLAGLDVDHVLPRSLGGADHPLNYQLLPSSVNRRIGAGLEWKVRTMPVALLQGLVASALQRLGCGR